jgi:hypothetical protein
MKTSLGIAIGASVLAQGCIIGAESDGVLSREEFAAKYVGTTHDSTGAAHLYYDWDQPLASEAQVDALYDLYRRAKTGGETLSEAVVNLTLYGRDVWSPADRTNLSYCGGDSFGARKQAMVSALATADSAWTNASNGAVRFVYRPDQDASCTNTNPAVVFNSLPYDEDSGVIASAFFPSDVRANRQLLVNVRNAFDPAPSFPFAGVLRHELGHALGLRHETTRAAAIVQFGWQCFEDIFQAPLTSFDLDSVMVTPACVGDAIRNKQLVLSPRDVEGIQRLYR